MFLFDVIEKRLNDEQHTEMSKNENERKEKWGRMDASFKDAGRIISLLLSASISRLIKNVAVLNRIFHFCSFLSFIICYAAQKSENNRY